MQDRVRLSGRRELKAIVARALAMEAELSKEASRRVVNRVLRQSDRISEAFASPAPRERRASGREAAPPVLVAVAPAAQPPFDPFQIGVVVTLQRHGADVLLDRLSKIDSVADLCQLAAAQNLPLKSGWSNADDLRSAIVTGAALRLAERRAAAS